MQNEQLLAALTRLVQQENELTSDLLAHLAELDERRLYLELGFPSLFAYCTESLGLSESSAGRRITAARVGRRFPDVFSTVARGELNLSILCALNPHLNQENSAELFKTCSNKKRQQLEEILAARFPRPDVRESIRKLPVRATGAEDATLGPAFLPPGAERPSSLPTSTLELAPNSPAFRRTQANIPAPSTPSARARIEPLSPDRYGVHFTADAELRDLMETARALASHRLAAGNIAELMKLALKAFIQNTEKKRFAVGRKPRLARASTEGPTAENEVHSPAESGTERSRHIPAPAAREVYARDRGRCSFVSANGQRCNSRVFLQLDHAEPWAVGGASTVVNLRLRCRAHNLLHARRYFGKSYMAAAIGRQSGTIGAKSRGARGTAP